MRLDAVSLEAVGFGEADYIEPLAPPMLAVAIGGEQLVDQLLPCVWRVVVDERFHFSRGRRQPRQVVVSPADQGDLVGRRRGIQAGTLQAFEDEAIDVP